MRGRSLFAIGVGAPLLFAAACFPDVAFVDGPGTPDATADSSPGSDAPIETSTEGGSPADAGPDAASCKTRPGPPMVRVSLRDDAGSFCIDALEVTNAQFNDFLRDPNQAFEAPPNCAGQQTPRWDPTTTPSELNLPAGVNWCYAHAYCKWAGKRLCGKLGGGGPLNWLGCHQQSEWHYACENGTMRTTFPYGDTEDASVCNTHVDGGGTPLLPPQSKPGCRGITAPFDRIYDMSGNSNEYIDCLERYDGSPGTVVAVGGHVNNPVGTNDCRGANAFGMHTRWSVTAVRCCADD
jgi:sulfatase modifying factor 1